MEENETQTDSTGIGTIATGVGLGVAGLLVPGLRKRGIKAVSSLFKKPEPSPKLMNVEEALETAPSQQLTVVPTKALDKIKKITAKEEEELQDIMKAVKKNPLTFGGQSPAFKEGLQKTGFNLNMGSALYDYVALYPTNKLLKAKEWVNAFKNEGKMNTLRIPTPGYADITNNVTRRELEDLNIAVFDDKNKIVGGFLKYALDADLDVGKYDLLQIIKSNPMAQARVMEFGPTRKMVDAMDNYADTRDKYASELIEFMKPKLKRLGYNASDVQKFERGVQGYVKDASDINAQNEFFVKQGLSSQNTTRAYRPEHMQQSNDLKNFQENFIKNFKGQLLPSSGADKMRKAEQTMAIFDNTAGKKLVQELNKHQRTMSNEIDTYKRLPSVYGREGSYRLHGPENYNELVVYIDPKAKTSGYKVHIPEGGQHYKSASEGAPRHSDQLYFMRFGMRSDIENPNIKNYAIDEIQADINQSVGKSMRAARDRNDPNFRRFNPYNLDFIKNMGLMRAKQLTPRARELADKGVATTKAERAELQEINSKVDNLLRSNQKVPSPEAYARGQPYLPMVDRKDYGEHALKTLVRKAIMDDVDFVSVNSVAVQHGKRTTATGLKEFYGASADNPKSVMYDAMLRLAKQYNSKVEKRTISKSDPKKEFKVLNETNEHVAAFKSEVEARQFVDRAMRENYGSDLRMLKIKSTDPRMYYDTMSLRITPEMKEKPFKLYKKTGGLVVNLFKW